MLGREAGGRGRGAGGGATGPAGSPVLGAPPCPSDSLTGRPGRSAVPSSHPPSRASPRAVGRGHSADSLQGRVAGIDGAGVEFTLKRGPRGWVRFTGRRVPWKPGSRPRFAPFTPRDPGRTADFPRLLLGRGNPHFRPPLRPGGAPAVTAQENSLCELVHVKPATRVSEERRKDKVWDPSAREMVGCFLSGF